jgi:hypothetical protein
MTQSNGQVIIFVIHEAHFGDRLEHTLLCPNQLRANGIGVFDVPRQLDRSSKHA